MILKQKVKVKWSNRIKEQYEALGFIFTKRGDEFEVDIDILPENSSAKVKVKCDYCENIIEKQYKKYIYERNKGKDCCKNCTHKKIIDIKLKNGNSLGDKFPELIPYWSRKNTLTPFDITYGSNDKAWWICNKGHEWHAKLPFDGNINCPRCFKDTTGEKKIAEILNKLNLKFKQQFSFSDLLNENNNPLKFDFAVFKDDKLIYLIEFDGRQHYQPVFGEETLKITKYRDGLKNKYCEVNNIKLIRIPFWEFENIGTIINSL